MKEFEEYYQTNFQAEQETECYDQLTHEEISLHKIYLKIWHPYCMQVRYLSDEKYIINEAIGRYCRKNSINVDHIFDINVLGELIPKRIKYGYLNVDSIVNTRAHAMIELEVKEFIKEIRIEIVERQKLVHHDLYSFSCDKYE